MASDPIGCFWLLEAGADPYLDRSVKNSFQMAKQRSDEPTEGSDVVWTLFLQFKLNETLELPGRWTLEGSSSFSLTYCFC